MINLDFADVKTIMSGMGLAIMGTGVAEGEDRAMEAANRAISSPLLEDASVRGARGVIINVTGGTDISLLEVSEASSIIQEAAHEDANIIFGAVVDPTMEGTIKITVIATGFDKPDVVQRPPQESRTPSDLNNYERDGGLAGAAACGGRVADGASRVATRSTCSRRRTRATSTSPRAPTMRRRSTCRRS